MNNKGPQCRTCRSDEQRCAFLYGECCESCSHWVRFDPAGNERLSLATGRRRLPVEHGSDRGYYQHRTRGELPCHRCRSAHSLAAGRRKQAAS